MRLGDLGEGALIRRIRDRFRNSSAVLGIGDDAAVLDVPAGHSIVFCSDLLAENTHFIRSVHPPESIGYKCVAVNVSDVGAMGGVPAYFLASLALPGDLDRSWFDAFLDGVERACRDFDVHLLGGDSSSAERIVVDVSMIGHVPSGGEIRRSGAKPGDGIYVTGLLGGSMLGLEQLRSGAKPGAPAQRHLYPSPRHRVGQAVAPRAHAMIDVSDGLSTDLMHVLEESKVSARIYKHLLPVFPGAVDAQALHGGEEYELLITALDLPAEIAGVRVTRIGEITPAELDYQIFLIDGSQEAVLKPEGFQHFAASSDKK